MSDTLLPEAGYPSSPHQAPVCLQKWGLQTVGHPPQIHPHEKAGDREEECRAHAFSHRLLSLLLWCLDYLHRAKAKCIRRPGLCRNTGGELFCTSIGANAARGHEQERVAKQSMWASQGQSGCRATLPMLVPPVLAGSCSFCLLLSVRIVKKAAFARYQGFRMFRTVFLCYLSLIHQHPHLLQEWFLASNSTTYCSGPRFDHSYLR